MMFSKNKQASFLNEKIVDIDDKTTIKMKILERLLGNFKEAKFFKEQFLKMSMLNSRED
jgi:hypothetical protein